ncbi:helix-turn-helix domain-containing protein [Paraburkholderia sp. A1RO-5L]|uniref:helix-turn-helix domain-containing protein n=1 Tax=unclassified Paraburkholderia TaxID=2615204 RepID=UPI003B7E7EB3
MPSYLTQSEQQAWEQALDVPPGWLFEAREADQPIEGDLYFQAGQRACARREALGISRRAVAARVGISIDALAQWERFGAPTRIKDAQTKAWEQALRVESGWLLGKTSSAVTPTAGSRLVSAAPDARSAILEVATRIAIARFETLAPSDARAEREQVSARIFAQRYGVDAPAGTALAAIAKLHGVVESRVSQILKALYTTAQGFEIDAGIFERIREEADPHLPCVLGDLEAPLRTLLGDGPTIEDVARFSADVLGKPLFAFAKRRVNGRQEIVVTSPDAGDAVADVSMHDTAIVEVARTMIRATGVAHMGLLKTYAVDEGWATDVIAKFDSVLARTEGFEWLGTSTDKQQWFWLRGRKSGGNLILDATRRVLAVASGAIALTEIVGAIDRLRSMRTRHAVLSPMFDVQPPARVIYALLQRQTWLSAPGIETGIRSLQNIDAKEALSPSELTVYEALRGVGGVASRAWLFESLVTSGTMDETSFRSAIHWGPSITRPYRGVYALRGFLPDPEVLASALQDSLARTSSLLPVAVDVGAARVVFHQVLNDWHLRGGWMTLPAALVAHVPQRGYNVHPDGGEVDVRASETRTSVAIRGLSRILRSRGFIASDVIRLTFELHANRLIIDLVPQSEYAASAQHPEASESQQARNR